MARSDADPGRIVDALRALKPEFRALGVRSLDLFGSVARGEGRPDSDVDILVEFTTPPGFGQYMQLRFLIEDRLGRRVDLVTKSGLRPSLLSSIGRDAIHVA